MRRIKGRESWGKNKYIKSAGPGLPYLILLCMWRAILDVPTKLIYKNEAVGMLGKNEDEDIQRMGKGNGVGRKS